MPGLSSAGELAREFAWMVGRSSLIDQAAWIEDPSRLHMDLTVLDQHEDVVRRMRMRATNERLKRLGMKELSLPPLPRREVEVPGEQVFYGGPVIRRPGIGRVLGVR